MIGKMMSLGFDLATLPARVTLRSARAAVALPENYRQIMTELREASEEAAREMQALLAYVDADMTQKAAHLNPQEKQRAAEIALHAAEQHLSMAAINTLRALWLAMDSNRQLAQDEGGLIIDQDMTANRRD